MRLLAIDYGTKKCGIAISDPLQIISQALTTIFYKNNDHLIEEISKIIDQYKPISKIIIGITKNIDGSYSKTSQITLKFKQLLELKTNIEVILVDERNTTKDALDILTHSNASIKDKKNKKDALAAQKILEKYLNFCK